MSIDNLQDLRFFNQVVRSQGFTAAAKALHLPVNTISRRVALMESRMGVCLLNRTTRKISITTEGQLLFDRSQVLYRSIRRLEEDLTSTNKQLSGSLLARIFASICLQYY